MSFDTSTMESGRHTGSGDHGGGSTSGTAADAAAAEFEEEHGDVNDMPDWPGFRAALEALSSGDDDVYDSGDDDVARGRPRPPHLVAISDAMYDYLEERTTSLRHSDDKFLSIRASAWRLLWWTRAVMYGIRASARSNRRIPRIDIGSITDLIKISDQDMPILKNMDLYKESYEFANDERDSDRKLLDVKVVLLVVLSAIWEIRPINTHGIEYYRNRTDQSFLMDVSTWHSNADRLLLGFPKWTSSVRQ